MNLLISNVVLRACAAVALASALLGCAHQASTISVNKQQKEPIKLEKVEFVFVPVTFENAQKGGPLFDASHYNGAFAHELGRTIKSVFLANGIDATILRPGHASSINPPPYRIVARPTKLMVHTGTYGSYTSLNVNVILHQRGVAEPIWVGTQSMPVSATRIREEVFGNFAMAVLNGLQTSGVAVLPQGHAVSPKGNKNYMLDVPTLRTDRSADGS